MLVTALRSAGILLVLGASLLAQDKVQLKTGAVMEGLIVEEGQKSIMLEFSDGGGTIELNRDQIQKIVRGKAPGLNPERQARLTLSRFADHASHHFLYRNGRRVGYRTIELKREVRNDVPGYLHRDRMYFLPAPGAPPEVMVEVREFADAELRPVYFSFQVNSGSSSRLVEGIRRGRRLHITESAGGKQTTRVALCRDGLSMPGIMMKDLATRPTPEGGYGERVVLDPRQVDFRAVELARHSDRVTWRGHVQDVHVFRRTRGQTHLETWLDMAGNVVREELGSAKLVSLRAPRSEVEDYARGEGEASESDLGLEFRSESAGLRLMRPNLSWEVEAGNPKNKTLVAMLRPSLRATVDVIELDNLPEGATEEGVLLRIVERMERRAKTFRVEGPERARIGGQNGLRFVAFARRKDENLKTLGAVVLEGRRAFVILCAAPERFYDRAFPDFTKVMESIQVLMPHGVLPETDVIPREQGG